jgi:hypothetical protein
VKPAAGKMEDLGAGGFSLENEGL